MNRLNRYLLSVGTATLLVGCGGGGGNSSSESSASSFSGIAVDGYISGATACLDLNISGTCDTNEPTTTTAQDGSFTFSDLTLDTNLLYPVIISGGIDTATGNAFKGELKNIVSTEDINNGVKLNVSPLTDLVATSFLESTTKDTTTLTTLKTTISTALGIDINVLDADTMKDTVAFAKAQEIQQLKELIKSSVTKSTGELTDEQESDITSSLVNQLTANPSLDVTTVLTNVENKLAITIPDNEKTFIVEQAKEINISLETIASDSTLNISNLDEIQNALESHLQEAKNIITNATEIETLTKVDLPDTQTLISEGETTVTNTKPYFLDGSTKITSKSLSIDENTSSSYSITAKDDDNDTLTFSLNGIDKDKFSINSTSGLLTIASFDYELPSDANTDNTYVLQVVVNDGKDDAYLELYVNITNIDDNDPILEDITDITLDKNASTYSLSLNANDADGTQISYSVTATKQDTLFTLELVESTLSITPITNKYGTDTISVTASSNGKTATKQFTLTIQDTGALVIPTTSDLPTPPMMPNL